VAARRFALTDTGATVVAVILLREGLCCSAAWYCGWHRWCWLDLLAGPLNLTAYGQPSTGPANEPNPYSVIPQGVPGSNGNLWGAQIFATTQVAAGTAVVMSVKAGAGIFWQRLGLLIMFDPYTLLSSNEYRWVAEERIAYNCPRPAALNLVTGLPTS